MKPGLRQKIADLQRRFTVFDLAIGVFLPGLAAALWPLAGDETPLRPLVFLGLLAVEIPPFLWAATLLHSYDVRKPLRRVLVHLYATVAFVGFAFFCIHVVLYGIVAIVIILYVIQHLAIPKVSSPDLAVNFGPAIGLLLCGAIAASILIVEKRRQRHERRKQTGLP